MSELAFNMNGEAFEVPAAAIGWRVRRMKLKGAPEVVYGRDGVPLVIPLDADIDDVRREVGGIVGRYRLDPVDDHHKPLQDASAGYVFVHAEARGPEPVKEMAPATAETVVIEAMRMNAELARTIVDRFPQMLEASALLLQAADGAGMPARPALAPRDSEDDGMREAGFDLSGFVAQLVPVLVTSFMSGKGKVPNLTPALEPPRTPKREVDAEAAGIEPMVPPLDPATMAHFIAVQAALTPHESAVARAVANDLSPGELRAWFEELRTLSVPDAVARVRSLIGGTAKNGGAS